MPATVIDFWIIHHEINVARSSHVGEAIGDTEHGVRNVALLVMAVEPVGLGASWLGRGPRSAERRIRNARSRRSGVGPLQFVN